MRIALYQPDIPQNVGAIMRLGACFGVPIDIVEPCGFVWEDRRLRRAGMDYREMAQTTRHRSWPAYLADRPSGRLILLTTRAATAHIEFAFRPDDCLLFGRESAGVPEDLHDLADASIRIPLRPGARSLNLAMAAAVSVGEALRQIGGFPEGQMI